MKSPEPESAPARAAAKAEEGAGTREPAPPRHPAGSRSARSPGKPRYPGLTSLALPGWEGADDCAGQQHPWAPWAWCKWLDPRGARGGGAPQSAARVRHRRPQSSHPLRGPWTSSGSVQPRSPPAATKGIARSAPPPPPSPGTFSQPWVSSAAFCAKPPRAVLGVQSSGRLPGRPLPFRPLVHLSLGGVFALGRLAGESRYHLPPRLQSQASPLGLGLPQCWGSRPGGSRPAPLQSAARTSSASLALPHPRRAQTPPSRGGCGHQGRLGRPLPRSLRSSRVARKALKPFHEHRAEPRFCVEEGAGNGRSGLGLPGSSLDARPQNRRRSQPFLAFRGLVVSVHEAQDPISSPPRHARPPPAVERHETAEVQAAAGRLRGRGGGGQEAGFFAGRVGAPPSRPLSALWTCGPVTSSTTDSS